MFIKVKFLKSHPDFGYFAGDTGLISPKAAEKLLQGGYIMIIPEAEIYTAPIPPAKVNPLPEDMPGRDRLFDAGFVTIEEIKEAGDSLLDAGISNNILKKVTAYLKDK